MNPPAAPYWFYHEYLDEHRRMRIHRITAETEKEARQLHRAASDFNWVTQHTSPTVSSLFHQGTYGPRAIATQQRPGHPYQPEAPAVECPPEIRSLLDSYKTTHA
jgi:hypothetical protein